jgi:prevent-host-death family protein
MAMRQFGTFDAKNRLSELLDLVEAGEEVLITRHGKPVARLVAPEPEDAALERRLAAAERIRELRKGITLGDITIRELIDEGRKY